MPRASVCLHLPKTGTTYTDRFFAAADWLQLRRACRLRRLRMPSSLEIGVLGALKRLGLRYGNLSPALRDRHAGYGAWPEALRARPTLCTLREVRSWYASQYLYYTRSMPRSMLVQAIRHLAHGGRRPRDPDLRAVLRRRRHEFLERFRAGRAGPDAAGHVSVEFFVWFNRTVRAECLLRRWTGQDIFPAPAGFLTVRAIGLLFEDPARVFGLPGEAFRAYFASGRYRRDLRCDHFLRFDSLTGDLCALMGGELGYDPDIVAFVQARLGRRNVSPGGRKPGVLAALDAGGLMDGIRRSERIYERYLLPLAGAANSSRP